ncbi:DUF7344 domain-containing protein [Haloarchaeobius sp. DT45]|uniref:DUF7344 domain-containing protein n=1 Tax=Haloarchaeobius sp. DT45 TaxID=3446116 RepID=UPI003F6B4919
MIRAIRQYLRTQKDSPSEYHIEPGTAHTLLKNERRREVLRELTAREQESIPVRELATAIACKENDIAEAALSSDQRKRVYVSLLQSHLPKLANEEAIEYDDERGRVSNTEKAEKLVIAEQAFRRKLETI